MGLYDMFKALMDKRVCTPIQSLSAFLKSLKQADLDHDGFLSVKENGYLYGKNVGNIATRTEYTYDEAIAIVNEIYGKK